MSADRCRATTRVTERTYSRLRLVRVLFPLIYISTLLASTAPWASAQTFVTFDLPKAQDTRATGINNFRQIAGLGDSSLFVFQNDTFRTLVLPQNFQFTVSAGINNRGQLVGSYFDSKDGLSHGFVSDGQAFDTVDFPPVVLCEVCGKTFTNTQATAINDFGQIVGNYSVGFAFGLVHGFLFSGGDFTSLDFPDAVDTWPTGINNLGQIIGSYTARDGSDHGFTFDGTTFTTVDFPNGFNTTLAGINNIGQIVGAYTTSGNAHSICAHGFVLTKSDFKKFDILGATLTCLAAINDSGVLAGGYFDGVHFHGFFVNPCQVVLPRVGQCDGKNGGTNGFPQPHWGGERYAYHTESTSTLCGLGCTLTALSMSLTALDVTSIPNFSSSIPQPNPISQDPGFLNKLMIRLPRGVLNDYDSGNNVEPVGTITDVTRLLSLQSALRFEESLRGNQSLSSLEFAVCHGASLGTSKDKPTPVIVQVKSQCSQEPYGHYVVVTGVSTDTSGNKTFNIADPAGNGFDAAGNPIVSVCPKNGRPIATCRTLDCPAYDNVFKIRGWVTDPTGDMSELGLSVGDPAKPMLVDSTGRRAGFDPQSGSILQEIPNSSGGEDRIDDDETGDIGAITRSVNVFQPQSGIYQVLVNGVTLGPFDLTVTASAQDDSPEPALKLVGITAPGSTSTFQLQFSNVAGSATTGRRVATFQSTLNDINNSLQLGLILNQGVSNSLSQKILAAQKASSQAAGNILNAFKDEVNAQLGKHIVGIAPQILIEDANWLISQLVHPPDTSK